MNRSKAALGFLGQRKVQDIVTQLDSAMNKWLASIPDHCAPNILSFLIFSRRLTIIAVCWDPKRKDDVFFNQSAILYGNYYALQIGVHRVFLTSSHKPGHQLFPSLAICTNAARSLSHVMDIQQESAGKPVPQQMVRVAHH